MGRTTVCLIHTLGLHKTIITEPPSIPIVQLKEAYNSDIEDMLIACTIHKPSPFVYSLQRFYKENGFLSGKQEKVLIDIYNSFMDG